MKQMTLTQGVLIALGLTGLSYCLLSVLTLFLWTSFSISLTLVAVSAIYCFMLIVRRGKPSGIVLGTLASVLPVFLVGILSIGPLVTLGIVLSSIWFTRCILNYQHLWSCLLDAALLGVAGIVAITSGLATESLVTGIWVFFLSQALWVFVPTCAPQRRQQDARQGNHGQASADKDKARFSRAYRSAQTAIERMTLDHAWHNKGDVNL